MHNRVIVIGDGWSALGALAVLAPQSGSIEWIPGRGSEILPAVASLPIGRGGDLLMRLGQELGVEIEFKTGILPFREWKGKAFHPPAWALAASPEQRREAMEDLLWQPEHAWVAPSRSTDDALVQPRPDELLALFRTKLVEKFPTIHRRGAVDRVTEMNADGVIINGQEQLSADLVVYADRWGELRQLAGAPKLPKKLTTFGVLQVIFDHVRPIAPEIEETFFSMPHKDSGDHIDRHVWCYFSNKGQRSVWTLALTDTEALDNHEVTKKLRRLKQTANRMFEGSPWTLGAQAGEKEFLDSAVREVVRFEEAAVHGGRPFAIDAGEKLVLLTDGWGMDWSLTQVERRLAPDSAQPEAESVLPQEPTQD